MALQTIFLGTPNNNDGDSLYAGGTKINANFSELYTQLAGSATGSLRIDLGTPLIGAPAVGDMLGWSPINNQFIPSSSTMLKTLSGNGSSVLILTNNTGKAGTDEEYTSIPNSLEMIFNGRRMWRMAATTTGSTAATRGAWFFGMGNAQATSLAITNRGVAIGGIDGLTVFRNNAEESGVSSMMISTGSSGIILYRTPIINSDDYKSPSDSSGTIVHSGFVQEAISRRGFANGTSTVTGARGVSGGGALSENRSVSIDGRFFPDFISGLTYNIRGTPLRLVVSPGAAVHYSFSVTGATVVTSTEVRSFVAATVEMSRAWDNAGTWTATNGQASLDTINTGTWYYVYLIVDEGTGGADIVATNSSSYSITESKLASAQGGSAYRVVRRLGCFRTLNTSIDPLPFVTTNAGGNVLRLSYANTGAGPNHSSSVETTSFTKLTVDSLLSHQGLLLSSVATTANAALYSSILIRAIPPLPGITAEINVIHNTTLITNAVVFFGEPWASSNATAYGANINSGPTNGPTQVVKDTVASVTSIHTKMLTVSPGNELIPDNIVAGSTVWGSTSGAIIRYAIAGQNMAGQPLASTGTPAFLGWDTRGFTIAR